VFDEGSKDDSSKSVATTGWRENRSVVSKYSIGSKKGSFSVVLLGGLVKEKQENIIKKVDIYSFFIKRNYIFIVYNETDIFISYFWNMCIVYFNDTSFCLSG
jgi:hypothetical protein